MEHSIFSDPKKKLSLFLWLLALHSFLVGISLIFLRSNVMELFGFSPITEGFFKVQGASADRGASRPVLSARIRRT